MALSSLWTTGAWCVGNRSFRLWVVSPTVCSPTSRVDSPMYNFMLSPTQINRHVNIACSKKDECVCVRIFLVLKKAPTNISMELQQLLFEFAKPSTNQIDWLRYRTSSGESTIAIVQSLRGRQADIHTGRRRIDSRRRRTDSRLNDP